MKRILLSAYVGWCIDYKIKLCFADPGGPVVYGVCLKPLYCWGRGFEFRWGMYFYLLCMLCCVGSGLRDKLVTHSEESCQLCVCLIVCDLET
jgi:hypothetical protein